MYNSEQYFCLRPVTPYYYFYVGPNYPEGSFGLPNQQQQIGSSHLLFENHQLTHSPKSEQRATRKTLPQTRQKQNIEIENPLYRKQVEGRNIHSNIFRSFLKYISSNEIYENFDLIRKKYGLFIQFDGFQKVVAELSKKYSSYVKKKEINSFISSLIDQQNQKDETVVLRILLYNYTRQKHLLCAFNSKKMKQKSWKFHLIEVRKLKEQIYKNSFDENHRKQ